MNEKSSTLLDKLWHEPPVFFPVAVVFHLFLLLRGFADLRDTFAENWPSLLWYAVAFVLSVFVLLMQRWAAIVYMLLTLVGVLLARVAHVPEFYRELGNTIFPFDAIYSAILLFFFKRFR